MTTSKQRRSRERARQRTRERLERQRARMRGEEKRPDPPFPLSIEGQILIIDDYVMPHPYFGGKTMKYLRKQIAESLTLPSSFWATDTTSLLDIFSGESK